MSHIRARHGIVAAGSLALVAGAFGAPAMAQDDEPEPTPTDLPALTPSGRPDLYLDMPYYIGGFEPESDSANSPATPRAKSRSRIGSVPLRWSGFS